MGNIHSGGYGNGSILGSVDSQGNVYDRVTKTAKSSVVFEAQEHYI
jgi:hypothetical protein